MKPILVQNMRAFKTQWKQGTCLGQFSDQSYIVHIEGQLVRRNRRFLKQSENLPMETRLTRTKPQYGSDARDGEWPDGTNYR